MTSLDLASSRLAAASLTRPAEPAPSTSRCPAPLPALSPPPMDPVTAALERHFGFGRFRAGQRQVVDAILAGQAVVAVMPTGAGKSLCYQLPAVLLDGVTVVVSPLIALMKDQVDALRERGIPAAFVNSSIDAATQRQVLEDAARGHLKLLYLAPERFRSAGAWAAIERLPLSFLAIDEAHCISQWGHDFRPDYSNLGHVARQLAVPRLAAFTATATRQVRHDIVTSLGLERPLVTVAGFLRENLRLSVMPIRKMRDKPRLAQRLIEAAGGPALVYCATRKHCTEAAAHLMRAGIEVVVYHGGLEDDARREAQEAFIQRDDVVMVATNAFGMGVDKPNVRAVIHWDIPGSVDAYYQEAGRAGRDGAPAWCTLLFTYADTRVQEFFIDNGGEGLPPDARAARAEGERAKLRAMVRYAYEEGCRHAAILRYFGDTRLGCDETSARCDNCRGAEAMPEGIKAPAPGGARAGARTPVRDAPRAAPRRLTEAEEIVVQKALSAVARARGELGVRAIARVLRGSRSRETLAGTMAGTRSFGILAGMPEADLVALLEALGRAGCTEGKRPRLTRLGADAMWRRTQLELELPPFGERASGGKPKRAPREEPDLDDAQREVLGRLKRARIAEARERGVSAFLVASNRLLEEIATLAPGSDCATWLEIKGIGPNNVDRLREVFAPLLDRDSG